MVDYDVLPTTLSPVVVDQIKHHVAVLHPHRVPCAIKASSIGAKWICSSIVSRAAILNSHTHASDMLFFQSANMEMDVVPIVVECDSPVWYAHHAIHFSSNSTRKAGWDRLVAMKGHRPFAAR